MTRRDLFIGYTDDRTRPTDTGTRLPDVPVYLTEAQRAAGVLVNGGSGSGKTFSLEGWIRQDIRARRGGAFIDWHGEAYDHIMEWCAYVRPAVPIIPLNLSTGVHVIGFNPLKSDGTGIPDTVRRNIAALIKAWGDCDTDSTPTLERILKLIFYALTTAHLTIAEALHLLSFHEHGIRDYLIDKIESPIIRHEWQELAGLSKAREWRDEILSAKNRLLRFLDSPTLMRFMGLGQSLDLRRIMDGGAFVLINLKPQRGVLSPLDARVFGSMFIAECFAVARERGGLGQPPPRPWYLFCDEFQNYVSPDLVDILPQSRKMGLALTLAHQFLAQLENEQDRTLVAAAMSACRTKVAFGGLSATDAEAMVPEIFAGQIDYHEVKRITYNTEHWPVYGRETVRNQSAGAAQTVGRQRGTGHVSGIGGGSSDADLDSWNSGAGLQWLPDGTEGVTFETSGNGGAHVHTEQSNWFAADNTFEGETEQWGSTLNHGTADIPFYYQQRVEVPKEEYWTSEEQKERLAHTLMLQLQRHCFVKPRDTLSSAVLVPMLKRYPLPVATVLKYEAEQATAAGSVPPATADAELITRTRRLEHQAREFFDLKQRAAEYAEPQRITRKPTKKKTPPKEDKAA